MRVWIDQHANQSSANIAGLLRKRGFEISKWWPLVTLIIESYDVDPPRENHDPPPAIIVDSVAGQLESNVTHWLATMAQQEGDPRNISLKRHYGVQDDSTVRVVLPHGRITAIAEQAIVAAVEVTLRKPRPTFLQRIFPELYARRKQ